MAIRHVDDTKQHDTTIETLLEVEVDTRFLKGARPYMDPDETGGSTWLLMNLAANEKAGHEAF